MDPNNALPPRPEHPGEPPYDQCCSSGCAYCVLDTHQDAVRQYELELQEWERLYGQPHSTATPLKTDHN